MKEVVNFLWEHYSCRKGAQNSKKLNPWKRARPKQYILVKKEYYQSLWADIRSNCDS